MSVERPFAHEFNKIGQYFLIERTELAQSDAGLIFGNQYIWPQLAQSAAYFYHQGYFPKIVVSGGVICEPTSIESNAFETEATTISNRLRALGVAQSDIILENKATNTQENVVNCKALFNQHDELNAAQSIISFGHIKASRRFLMTLKANWPEMFAMHIGVNPYHMPAHNWQEHPNFRESVIDQYHRIEDYIDKGWIKEVDISEINLRATLPRGPKYM